MPTVIFAASALVFGAMFTLIGFGMWLVLRDRDATRNQK